MCYAPSLKLFLKKVSAPLLPQPMSIKILMLHNLSTFQNVDPPNKKGGFNI